MRVMLSHGSTYQPFHKDPTPGIQHRMDALLLKLKMEGELSALIYYHLRCSCPSMKSLVDIGGRVTRQSGLYVC